MRNNPLNQPYSFVKSTIRYVMRRFPSFFLTNNASYWDRYVLQWKLSGKSKEQKYLGWEWEREKQFLLLLEEYSAGKEQALEIGCGGGRITSYAKEYIKRIHATDFSEKMVKETRRALGHCNSITFQRTDGFTLKEIASDSMDVVYAHEVFIHLTEQQVYKYFLEIRRVLKSDGVAVVSFFDILHHFDDFEAMATRYQMLKQFPPHMRYYFTTEEILRFFAGKANMDMVRCEREIFMIVVLQPSRKQSDTIEPGVVSPAS